MTTTVKFLLLLLGEWILLSQNYNVVQYLVVCNIIWEFFRHCTNLCLRDCLFVYCQTVPFLLDIYCIFLSVISMSDGFKGSTIFVFIIILLHLQIVGQIIAIWAYLILHYTEKNVTLWQLSRNGEWCFFLCSTIRGSTLCGKLLTK